MSLSDSELVELLSNRVKVRVRIGNRKIKGLLVASYGAPSYDEIERIKEKRQQLLEAFKEKNNRKKRLQESTKSRRPTRRRVTKTGERRASDGSLIYSTANLTRDQFIEETELMSKVNHTFQRTFTAGVSRPKLQQLGAISEDVRMEIRDIFFADDGSLRKSINVDIDTSLNDDPKYITFQNINCPFERNDLRFQVPFRKHSTAYRIETRSKVEAVLVKNNIITKEEEEVHDIGLLFGGTEDQPLHHDTARQLSKWFKEPPSREAETVSSSLEEIDGWEIDRLEYNESMSSSVAPSSILIGLGDDSDNMLLGVQKNLIVRTSDGKSCIVRSGVDGQVFPIVRETKHLVVIKIVAGCMFTGDFIHAGVRNIPHGSDNDNLMIEFNARVKSVFDAVPKSQRLKRNKKLLKMMNEFRGLDKLCRLHCSTDTPEKDFYIPYNAIGFTDCSANPPDNSYVGDDQNIDLEGKSSGKK